MGKPKITYTLGGVARTITFDPVKFSSFKPKWEKDQLPSKNPFTGKKDWKLRGYYYTATLYYDKMLLADFLALRDLWNKNIENAVLYPDDAEVRCFPVKVTSDLGWEDSYPEIIEDVTILFSGINRYDSPMEYDDGYWGTRAAAFAEAVPYDWATQRTELNAADAAMISDLGDVTDGLAAHLAEADPHPDTYYTKTEVAEKIAAATAQVIVLAGLVGSGNDFVGMAGYGPALVHQDGTLTKVYIAFAGASVYKGTITPGIAVKAGDRITMRDGARSGDNVKLFLMVNGESVYGTTSTFSDPEPTSVECMATVLVE